MGRYRVCTLLSIHNQRFAYESLQRDHIVTLFTYKSDRLVLKFVGLLSYRI